MSTPKTRFDLVAARKYQTRSGEEKTHWLNCGEAVEWSDGGITIRQDTVPTFAGWDGKFSLFVKKEREQQQQAPQRQVPAPKPTAELEDNIPF
jgi:hypothetical protein